MRENYQLTSEHKTIMGQVFGEIPFSMPELREYDLDYDVPSEYPGTIKWLSTIKTELNEMRTK